jgi:type III secretion protein J
LAGADRWGVFGMVSRLKLFAVLAIFALAGCRQELYSNLPEVEANKMLAVLMANGISVSKTSKGAKEGFTLEVPSQDMLRAIAVLNDAGFPKTAHVPLSKVFEKSGIMSSPFEERVRYIYALGEEVSHTLGQIDGVVTARVHIVLPEAPQLGQQLKPSSAAVFIKHQPGVDLDFFAPQIRRLVSSSIEGLEYSAVTVVLTEAAPTKVGKTVTVQQDDTVEVLPGLVIKQASEDRFWQIVTGGLAFVVLIIAFAVLGSRQLGRRAKPAAENPVAMAVEPS